MKCDNYSGKSTTRALVAAGLAMAAAATYGQQCPSAAPRFADEFNGSAVDTSKWEVQTGDGCSYGLCGWGNNELQSYQAANAVVANGVLTITAKKQRVGAKAYTSARLRTLNRPGGGQWTHGRFEARMKTPSGSGMWPAFWMLPANTTVAWPASGEIDIQESTGQKSMFAWGTVHYGSSNANHQFLSTQIYRQPDSFADGFHVYSVNWSPYKISWYIDDVLYATKTPADMANSADWTFESYQYYLLLNLAVGGNLGGAVDDSKLPQTLQVDYVRGYAYPQPSLSGKYLVEPNTATTYGVVDQVGTGATYAWSAPNGQTSSASSFTVNWGTTGGTVAVNISDSCGSYTKNVAVTVAPVLTRSVELDDYEAGRNLAYTTVTGTFTQAVANPAPGTVNGSATVAKYVRNAGQAYDLVTASTSAIADASFYVRGEKALYLDVYTAAPVGTPMLIQMENKNVATASNFPSGRHSKYIGYTTLQNGWQRVKFRLDDRLDGATGDAQVNQLVLMLAPTTLTGDTYYIDNYNIYAR
ncbi:family 16 glycosylhydrolase [Massilia sp. TWR1-2-2]|uniref:family 16 glycosylhydrolase n=1 Tax=Massilia sp. TWR1-2-2 TaxID=2804584 RepID=UPI003CF90256